jgi:flagellar motor protein MotB
VFAKQKISQLFVLPARAADKKPVAKPAEAAKPAAGNGEMAPNEPLSETVKGEIKEKLDIQKPPPSIELNVKEIIDSGTDRTEEVLQQARPIPSDADFDHYAMIDSNQVLHSWNPLVPEPPLVTFYPGLSKVATKRWEFKVSDQGGEVVKTITGKGVPPRSVQWDGRNERNTFITVGTLYSYQFITYDEHDNAQTFPGEPFQLDALKYDQKNKVFVEFSNDRLFTKDQSNIAPNMKGLWDRAIDIIRENSNKPITVEMYADSVKSPLAEERRQALVDAISNATNIPAVDIRHKVDKIADRGNIVRIVMGTK